MEYQVLKVDVQDNIAIVELDRKKELNALSGRMIAELHDVFGHFLPDNDEIKVAILTGGDQCFSAGMDIKESSLVSPDDLSTYCEKTVDAYIKLMDFDRILICAVNGIALGGGFNLAMMGDIVLASENAIFAHPEIKFGLNPILTPLIYRVGVTKAKELSLRGDPVGAREAHKMGLINRVVSPENMHEETMAWARQLAQRPHSTVRTLKRAFDVVPRLNAKAAIEYELEMSAMLMSSDEDLRNRMKSFLRSATE